MPPQPFHRLKKGSEDEDVYWLQMKLKELGYYTGTVTGAYYNGTAKAVKAYQKANGLYADGVAGINTLEKLYADVLAGAVPSAEPSETVQVSSTPGATGTVTPSATASATNTPKPTATVTPSGK
ncbi:MAG: peptidoglycan-binding domain-containing protein [Clostridia bacterium]